MSCERTYQVVTPPARPPSWTQYERIIQMEWDALLNRQPFPSEPEVQAIFERHPSIVPGAFGIIGGESGHYPRLCGMVAQAPLPSYDRRVPDFLWLSGSSDTEQPVLVEIEAPSKPWFTKAGTPTAGLTQALDQIVQWKAWFDVPHNVEAFKAFYGLDREAWRRRRFKPAYLLIYGRRSEANAKPLLTQKRAHLHPDDVVTMTYDRLRPNPKAGDLCCLRAEASGVFRVVSVPATLTWKPALVEQRGLSHGWHAAIEANRYISPERKAFLIERRPYWEKWGRRNDHGVIFSSDEE